MAVLIPTLGSSLARMTGGEKRLARQLEAKLEDDYLVWYDVPVGTGGFHPDFMVLHPRRGLLVLEVKDWRLSTLQRIDKTHAVLVTSTGARQVLNPLEQARLYAQAVSDRLQRDPALVAPEGARHAGKLRFPWSYGVVLANIRRAQFEATDLGEVLPPHRVICQDELTEGVDAEGFQRRLWEMFPWAFEGVLTLPQIDRIRWQLFPEIRVARQTLLFEAEAPDPKVPDIVRLMDLQQEQLARSLGEGHRVVHGVAGSGKTMLLAFRCQHLARVLDRPILVLCFNVALAARLGGLLGGEGGQVTVRSFHAWCRDQLQLYHVPLPPDGPEFVDTLVRSLARAVERGQVPCGQYGAVLVDEGHDFEPPWLELVARMVHPDTNALLLLYDDAQSIYGGRRRRFSFKSVGIQAQGRTAILRVNYRNTAEVLALAYQFAQDVLTPESADEDGVPLVRPESAQRHGPPPELVELPSFSEETRYVAERLRALGEEGVAWRDMAVVYHTRFMGEKVVQRLHAAGVPVEWVNANAASRQFRSEADSVKVVTFHSSKGLEFPVVAIPGLGYLPYEDRDLSEQVRLAYVAMTRAMDRLILTCHRESAFVTRLKAAARAVAVAA